jgi:aldose 1-epimerase
MNLIELRSADTTVTVAPEAGGRIVQIVADLDGSPTGLLVEPDDPQRLLDEPLAWGCYPMAPWPGRVDGSRFTWDGVEHALPANDGRHSIHGRAVYLPWSVEHQSMASCALSIAFGPAEGWPFACVAEQHIEATDHGVNLRLAVKSAGETFPAGVGWHPWFRRDVRPGAEAAVRVPAPVHYERRQDLIPTGVVGEPAGDADLRAGPVLGERRLDDFYGGVVEAMEITWGDLRLRMTSGWNVQHAVVFTEQERGFCVEPQTCAPDAFNLYARGVEGTGLAVVEPGIPLVAQASWRWQLADS